MAFDRFDEEIEVIHKKVTYQEWAIPVTDDLMNGAVFADVFEKASKVVDGKKPKITVDLDSQDYSKAYMVVRAIYETEDQIEY